MFFGVFITIDYKYSVVNPWLICGYHDLTITMVNMFFFVLFIVKNGYYLCCKPERHSLNEVH